MICPASETIATACVACSREISTSRDRIATGPRGGVTMSELAETGVETIEQSRVDEPPRTRTYEERSRIAKGIVQGMQAVGIDCELAEAASAH